MLTSIVLLFAMGSPTTPDAEIHGVEANPTSYSPKWFLKSKKGAKFAVKYGGKKANGKSKSTNMEPNAPAVILVSTSLNQDASGPYHLYLDMRLSTIVPWATNQNGALRFKVSKEEFGAEVDREVYIQAVVGTRQGVISSPVLILE